MLEDEAKKMEEKLETVKKMMELEKQKRDTLKKSSKDGTVWRSATTQKQISGYSQAVLAQHRINQPNLPPTTMILGKENEKMTNNMKTTGYSSTSNAVSNIEGGVARQQSNQSNRT
jgi:hypothetical protein